MKTKMPYSTTAPRSPSFSQGLIYYGEGEVTEGGGRECRPSPMTGPLRPLRRGLYHSVSFTEHMNLLTTSPDASTARRECRDLVSDSEEEESGTARGVAAVRTGWERGVGAPRASCISPRRGSAVRGDLGQRGSASADWVRPILPTPPAAAPLPASSAVAAASAAPVVPGGAGTGGGGGGSRPGNAAASSALAFTRRGALFTADTTTSAAVATATFIPAGRTRSNIKTGATASVITVPATSSWGNSHSTGGCSSSSSDGVHCSPPHGRRLSSESPGRGRYSCSDGRVEDSGDTETSPGAIASCHASSSTVCHSITACRQTRACGSGTVTVTALNNNNNTTVTVADIHVHPDQQDPISNGYPPTPSGHDSLSTPQGFSQGVDASARSPQVTPADRRPGADPARPGPRQSVITAGAGVARSPATRRQTLRVIATLTPNGLPPDYFVPPVEDADDRGRVKDARAVTGSPRGCHRHGNDLATDNNRRELLRGEEGGCVRRCGRDGGCRTPGGGLRRSHSASGPHERHPPDLHGPKSPATPLRASPSTGRPRTGSVTPPPKRATTPPLLLSSPSATVEVLPVGGLFSSDKKTPSDIRDLVFGSKHRKLATQESNKNESFDRRSYGVQRTVKLSPGTGVPSVRSRGGAQCTVKHSKSACELKRETTGNDQCQLTGQYRRPVPVTGTPDPTRYSDEVTSTGNKIITTSQGDPSPLSPPLPGCPTSASRQLTLVSRARVMEGTGGVMHQTLAPTGGLAPATSPRGRRAVGSSPGGGPTTRQPRPRRMPSPSPTGEREITLPLPEKNICLTVYMRRWSTYSDHDQSEGGSGPPSSAPRLGTPSLKERSSSVGAPPIDSQPRHAAPVIRQQSVSSTNSATTGRLQRQRSYKRSEDDEKLKKSRAWANAYELSQDLHEKQLEMLERKYGGHVRARRAARVIQQAFRQYCMNKNFEKLRSVAGEKRLSRRFAELQRSNTIWTDMVVDSGYGVGLDMHVQNQFTHGEKMGVTRSGTMEDNLNQNVETGGRSRLQKSYSLNMASHTLMQDAIAYRQQRRPLQRSLGLDLSSIKEGKNKHGKKAKALEPSPEETNNNRNSYPEMNDSSASDSPQDTPVEPTVDLPSVNFENLLESKETDILNDSFHSDSSQDAAGGLPTSGPGSGKFSSFASLHDQTGSCEDITGDNTLTRQHHHHYQHHHHHHHPQQQQHQQRTSQCANHIGQQHEVQIRVEDTDCRYADSSALTGSDSDRTPTQEDGEFKMYANTPVRLRKKKCANHSSSSSSSSIVDNNSQCYTSPTLPPQSSASSSSAAAAQQSASTQQQHVNGAHYEAEGVEASSDDYLAQAQVYVQAAQGVSKMSPEASPIWKRKSQLGVNAATVEDAKRMSNISEASEPESLDGREGLSSSTSSETASLCSDSGPGGYHRTLPSHVKESPPTHQPQIKITDRQRKRLYRIGLNLFNKKPEKGIKYLIERRFVENRPTAVAKFLISRKGLSKQMIGEFLGNLQKQFNNETLIYFAEDIDLSGLQVDMALRKFQSFFRMPGEAQKIERLMEAFAERYYLCNPDQVKKFRSADTVFLLAFAIIMLNTDLHNQSIKPERKMKPEDFIRNLRGIDDGDDIDRDMLQGIYDRILLSEFRPGTDHVSQVMKVESMIVGKKPQLSLPHRRLVCYCRLYEVHDPNKREKLGLHQREVFLFNDVILITKIFSKKKSQGISYSFRQSFSLCGMQVYLFETPHYQHGIRLTTNIDGKVLITFNARNEHDRTKFVEDLKEAILEMNEMEALRIEEELQKQKMGNQHHGYNRHSKDSGMVDIELLKPTDPGTNRLSAPECGMKKTTLSNSLIDLSDAALRRGSGGSLDSGMASTSSGSTGSHEDGMQAKGLSKNTSSSSRFGGLFGKKSKSSSGTSKTSLKNVTADSSEV